MAQRFRDGSVDAALLLTIETIGASLYAMANTINYNISINRYRNFITPLIILFCPEGADMAVTSI